jgi:hypothetical protein
LLDGLERFSSYVKTELVKVNDLKPYLGYWLHDIAADTDDPADAAWSAALLTYIQFYGYRGVQSLFAEFGAPIEPTGSIYQGFLKKIDPRLAEQLAAEAAAPYSQGAAS